MERVVAGEGVIYWRCPVGSTLTTPFAAVLAHRRLRARTTTRNLTTLEKMVTPVG